ncbi:MAG: helix-turn-helix transcriptional regulator [Bacteroidaceae bacterium]|nr:helix-turn-helix transcriptional regulator [Bacteroidaceae bacterium]
MRERIKEIIEREGMGQSQFADFIGVNRPTLSHILAGRNNPSMEVVMKIHQKFPKINILWLLDGIGSYGGDAVADDTDNEALENSTPATDLSPTYTRDEHETTAGNGQPSSRFYQGDLFAENPIFTAESTGAAKNRKEMPLQTPQKAPYLSDTQIEYAKKSLQRKIVEIKIFYDDGTYETFKP